ncbi:MAG: hypothetical protein CMG74_10030 [Candidatus Marinimicrobia bacterium]|nr:hypothetical protein [Candidatus Neomarinimicrobiota bacterium]|tara:strand:- start:1895 stop:2212 length:318 start_codon:yes stop_codon:yes gene_type:complete
MLACEKNIENDLKMIEDCSQREAYYESNIKPIFDSRCTSCHSGTSPSGGLAIDTYETAYSAIKSGHVLDRIQRETNDPDIMPPSGQKLSAENILLIQTFFEMNCQ